MILVDSNVLLYAYHPRSPHHERCRAWLEAALSGDAPVAICWWVAFAFLRIGTSPRAFDHPLAMAEAVATVSRWLEVPNVVMLEPGPRYWDTLREIVAEARVTGPLVTDAAIAALALEHGAAVCTTDRDFRRFTGLRLIDPLAA